MSIRKRIITTLSLAITTLALGTVGYRIVEGWDWLDALYMSVITMTTVGFGEIQPLSPVGRLFTIIVIIGGVGVVAYALSSTADAISSGQLAKVIQENRRIKLKNHCIVCGFGRVGRFVAEALEEEKIPFVVIDRNPEAIEACDSKGYKAIQGNAASIETLEKAGIIEARVLITAVNSDAENVFIVLTVRELREDITIISRSNFRESEPKLLKAGADQVISPYALAGDRMVNIVSRPIVTKFLDVVLKSEHTEMYMEEVDISVDSPFAGKTLGSSRLRSEIGVSVLAVDLPEQQVITHPAADTPLPIGARLIVLGTREQLKRLNNLSK